MATHHEIPPLHSSHRLRAAASLSPHQAPTCMAIRKSNSSKFNMAAIANPMGITIMDVLSPHRPRLVLNYATGEKGVECMSFQPSSDEYNNNTSSNVSHGPSGTSPILLATARGGGIMIWDCSGRSLSPLLGRLSVSDGRGEIFSGSGVGPCVSKGDVDDSNMGSHNNMQSLRPPLPPSGESTPAGDKKSNVSLSSASSATSNAATASGLDGSFSAVPSVLPSASNLNTSFANSSSGVTSLAWKGPLAPILLATTGSTTCLFDLRTSLFAETTSNTRPNARFCSSGSSTIVHCCYSHDESLSVFSTIDSTGVVRLWDDRKSDICLSSFVGHTRQGVGVASLPSADGNTSLRWVTWGLDESMDNVANNDDLVVKVWGSLQGRFKNFDRAPTVSTVTLDNMDKDVHEVDQGDISMDSHRILAWKSMEGAVAARVHPLFPDGVVLFRSQFDTPDLIEEEAFETEDAIMEEANSFRGSPMRIKKALVPSLEMTTSPETPLSPLVQPPVPADHSVVDWQGSSKGGWEAQVMQLNDDSMKEIASIEGGGKDDDALLLAPGSTNNEAESKIIAVELAHSSKELLLCTLTKSSFRVYGLPGININTVQSSQINLNPSTVELEANKMTSSGLRVFKKPKPASWWNQSEEDVFGDLPSTRRVEDITSSSGGNVETRLSSPLPVVENITNLIAPEKNASLDDGEMSLSPNIDEPDVNVVIDLDKAKLCPCPPLCGVAFGRAGTLVTFSNGPVRKMWSWYRESSTGLNQSYNEKPVVYSEVVTTTINLAEKSESNTDGNSHQPRTLYDLIEMKSAATIAQWGVDPDSNNSNDQSPDSSTGSSEDHSFDASSDELSQSDDSDGFEKVEVLDDSFAGKFDEYFASSRKSLTHIDMNISATEIREEEKNFAGITSLAPSVFVTNEYSSILLNGQSPRLAQQLELGDAWWLLPDFSMPDSWEESNKNAHSSQLEQMQLHPTFDAVFTRQPSHESSRSASMVGNLKKMFALQSPSATIPADQKLFKNKRQPVLPSLDFPQRQHTDFEHEYVPLGIYVTERVQTSKATLNRFTIARNLCLRNAEVLRNIGDKSKSDTWVLLAQAFQSDNFDGWGSGCFDALTTGLVEQLFTFYENEGDFQQLATMVCVLTLGRDRRSSKGNPVEYFDKYTLLSRRCKDRIRFDNYLRRYADLLYSWGVLTVRNEITKRISYSPEDAVSLPAQKKQTHHVQCAICCSSVRGAGIFCPSCGHGGHLEHIISWFQTHKTCPTGCGCLCSDQFTRNI